MLHFFMPPKKPASPAAPRKPFATRVFKTSWFAKKAGKRGITDVDLCVAMHEVMAGKAVALGGGVWKKKLNDNMDRSIIVAKGGENWIFVYLFMKKDRENIDKVEEAKFKKLAADYALLTPSQIQALLDSRAFVEICDGAI